MIALARQGHAPLTPPPGASAILEERGRLEFVVDNLSDRARNHAQMSAEDAEALRQRVKERTNDLLDEWSGIANDYKNQGVQLQYQQREMGAARPLLHEFLNPDLKKLPPRFKKFRANRSMRDVESSVNLWLKTLDDIDVEEDEV